MFCSVDGAGGVAIPGSGSKVLRGGGVLIFRPDTVPPCSGIVTIKREKG